MAGRLKITEIFNAFFSVDLYEEISFFEYFADKAGRITVAIAIPKTPKGSSTSLSE